MKGNSITKHPGFHGIVLELFPRLIELDGKRLDRGLMEDVWDAKEVGEQLVGFLLDREKDVIQADRDVA